MPAGLGKWEALEGDRGAQGRQKPCISPPFSVLNSVSSSDNEWRSLSLALALGSGQATVVLESAR